MVNFQNKMTLRRIDERILSAGSGSLVVDSLADKDDWQKAFWFEGLNSYLKNRKPMRLDQWSRRELAASEYRLRSFNAHEAGYF